MATSQQDSNRDDSLRPEMLRGSGEILVCVDAICASPVLAGSKRLIRFLRFIVAATLRGAGEQLSEYSIGVDVYDRTEAFDPRIDNIVRVEARRLRSKLVEYYRTHGSGDRWIIELPRGSYQVGFRRREAGAAAPEAGRDFGHYHLVSHLSGEDDWAAYLAEDMSSGRTVVLTILSPPEQQDYDRVVAETKRLVSLSHPSVCEIYETGVEGRWPYVAARHLEGQTLGHRLSKGEIPAGEAHAIAIQIASGVKAAHEAGLSHLAPSPESVILTESPDGKVEARTAGFGRVLLTAGDTASDLRAFEALMRSMALDVGTSIAASCSNFGEVLQVLGRAHPTTSRGRFSPWKAAVLLTVVALFAVGGWAAFQYYRTATSAEGKSIRIVVLPFDNLGKTDEDAGLAMAVTESVTSQLTQSGMIQVISRTSAKSIKDQKFTIPEVGSRLRVDYVLEGSVLRQEGRCRIVVELVRTSDDSHMWSVQHDASWANIFALQEEVSKKVLARLLNTVAHLPGPPSGRAGTRSTEAFEAFGRGLEAESRYVVSMDLKVFESAEMWYLRALELDPGYVEAMTELGRLYMRRLYPPRGPIIPWLMKAAGVLERAVNHEPNNVAANALLGSLYAQEGDVRTGVGYARRAVALGEMNSQAYCQLALAYVAAGYYEDALETSSRAVDLDPVEPGCNLKRLWVLAKLGRMAEARAALLQFRQSGAPALLASLSDADNLIREQKPENVARILKEAKAEEIGATAIALAAAMQPDPALARQMVQAARARGPRSYDWLIRAAALIGDKDTAIDEIFGSPYYRNYRWVVTEPSLRPFRGDRRFQSLVRGLYDDWNRNLTALRAGLHHPPPALPSPDQYFAGAAR
ncbi:MAG: tetratricopeptide repeat protein [Acidobacteria bacterium]|nr:tetratricopeptide repeat protein [Acidobacteriota bacterium]